VLALERGVSFPGNNGPSEHLELDTSGFYPRLPATVDRYGAFPGRVYNATSRFNAGGDSIRGGCAVSVLRTNKEVTSLHQRPRLLPQFRRMTRLDIQQGRGALEVVSMMVRSSGRKCAFNTSVSISRSTERRRLLSWGENKTDRQADLIGKGKRRLH
jgi:hypothetical protein